MKHIKNKLKPPKAFNEWCLSQLPIYEWSNKNKTIRSSNRKFGALEKKQLRKNSQLNIDERFYSFGIILVSKKRIEIQSYGYWLSVKNGKEDLSSRLTNFEKFENDTHIKLTKQFGRYIQGLSNNYGIMGGPYERTTFYENDWETKIKEVSELKYLDLTDYKIERWGIENLYKNRWTIEFFQKIKCVEFANDLMQPLAHNRTIDMRVVTKKWQMENKHLLKNNSDPFPIFELKRRIKERRGTYVQGIEEYLGYHDIKDIPKNIGITRFQRYIIKNKINFNTYLDYLSIIKDLNMDITSERLLLPHDLQNAHDEAVKVLNKINKERENKRFEERLKELKALDDETDTFYLLTPKESKEIVQEGDALSHCVGTSRYIDRHLKGIITLVFIRDKNNVDKPLYTCEVQDGRIIQIRGKANKIAPDDVYTMMNHWIDGHKELLTT